MIRFLRILRDRIESEPALVGSLVGAVLVTVQEFGLDLSTSQESAVQALTLGVVALFIRSKVTPTARI